MPISHRSNPRPMGSSFAGVQENQRDSLVSEKQRGRTLKRSAACRTTRLRNIQPRARFPLNTVS